MKLSRRSEEVLIDTRVKDSSKCTIAKIKKSPRLLLGTVSSSLRRENGNHVLYQEMSLHISGPFKFQTNCTFVEEKSGVLRSRNQIQWEIYFLSILEVIQLSINLCSLHDNVSLSVAQFLLSLRLEDGALQPWQVFPSVSNISKARTDGKPSLNLIYHVNLQEAVCYPHKEHSAFVEDRGSLEILTQLRVFYSRGRWSGDLLNLFQNQRRSIVREPCLSWGRQFYLVGPYSYPTS